MNLNDIIEYDKEVSKLAEEQTNKLIWNDSCSHNAVIMKEMFKHAHNVRMFCGKGSIFQDKFSQIVKDEAKENIINDLYSAIIKFLEKQGKLTIILQKKEVLDDVSEQIYKALKDKTESGDVQIYHLDSEIKPEFHFSIGDNQMYRRETGAEEHSAFANFNDREKAKSLNNQFELLLETSYRINDIAKA
ncbi:hypothetical protein [Phocaeicola vulgatus]|uniref:hypothetical protein n=1 Tax=Phocaeicola vulgatus TaxID=821 RepID=UPI001F344996|nr:hypothetical protein [Phocaeicola vulgatus]MCG0318400.1 hypothetical protein [Phocaeicola vulgatus]